MTDLPPVAGSERRAIVVGAGLVGVCCGLYLQRDGWLVTIVDPLGPGESCSSGNAGVIVSGAIPPLANRWIFRDLPRLLTDRDSPLSIRWSYLPRLLPWLVRFARASSPEHVEAGTAALTSLIRHIPAAWAPLLADPATAALMRSRGQLFVFGTQSSLERARSTLELRRRHGSTLVEVGPDDIRQIEPALAPGLAGGWYRTDGSHLLDPHRFTVRLAEQFTARGGTLLRGRVNEVTFSDGRASGVITDRAPLPASAVVIAAGAWSRPFARQLGLNSPLDTERGYSLTLPNPCVELGLPVSVADGGFFMTPMASGLRLAGTVEFGGFGPAPDPKRFQSILRRARAFFPALNDAGAIEWMGFRPSLPDSLPIIAAAPGRPGAYLAFGHGHLGISLAAVTGQLVAELAGGRPPSVPLSPFRADRF